jgi:hypothetical protein
MSRISTSGTPTFTDPDEAPPLTQADFDRAVYRTGRKSVEQPKVHVEVMLDPKIVRFFEDAAGDRGFTALIREVLVEHVRRSRALEPSP